MEFIVILSTIVGVVCALVLFSLVVREFPILTAIVLFVTLLLTWAIDIEAAEPPRATVKAAPLDCMLAIEPRTAAQSSVGEPLGGGGAFGVEFVIVGMLLFIWLLFYRYRQLEKEHALLELQLRESLKELRASVLPDFALLEIYGAGLGRDDRQVILRFATVAGTNEFRGWLRVQRNRARLQREAHLTREDV